MTEVRVVLVTGPDLGTLREIASTLLAERLIACANLGAGVLSLFRWKGAVQSEEEAIGVLKTTADRIGALRERFLELHPYEVPEFLVLSVAEGARDYLDWVADSVD